MRQRGLQAYTHEKKEGRKKNTTTRPCPRECKPYQDRGSGLSICLSASRSQARLFTLRFSSSNCQSQTKPGVLSISILFCTRPRYARSLPPPPLVRWFRRPRFSSPIFFFLETKKKKEFDGGALDRQTLLYILYQRAPSLPSLSQRRARPQARRCAAPPRVRAAIPPSVPPLSISRIWCATHTRSSSQSVVPTRCSAIFLKSKN